MRFIGTILSLLIITFTLSLSSAAGLNSSVVKLKVRSFNDDPNCYSSEGAAFFLDSLSRLHTAAHVIYKCNCKPDNLKNCVENNIQRQGPYEYVSEISISNDDFAEPLILNNVKLIKYDKESDHAILDLTDFFYDLPPLLTYLRTAKEMPQADEPVISAGYANHSSTLVIKEGHFISPVLKPGNNIVEFAIAAEVPEGQSGGPTVNSKMDVIGINRSRVNSNEGRLVRLLN